MRHISMYLDEDYYRTIKRIARERMTTASEIIREAVGEYLKANNELPETKDQSWRLRNNI